MSVATPLVTDPPDVDPEVAIAQLRELSRGAVEPFSDDWAYRLNAVARWILDNVDRGAWGDFRRSWLDLRRIFGPVAALRLLNLAELAELVPDDAD